jgi:response regulator of citrate/malate metabolism
VIRVLIVEDQPVAAEAHAEYVGRVPGFEVAGQARTGAEALRQLGRTEIDLVLLDMYLPDMHGLDLIRSMRAAGHSADVIAVTVARDASVIRAAVAYGIVYYLVKPFAFRTLHDKLEHYRQYRDRAATGQRFITQHQVDDLLAGLHGAASMDLPKGMSRESLDAVVAALDNAGTALSAAEVAEVVGASRVTARRYLEYLAGAGLAMRQARYGTAGRPEVEYRLRPATGQGHDTPLTPPPTDPAPTPRR